MERLYIRQQTLNSKLTISFVNWTIYVLPQQNIHFTLRNSQRYISYKAAGNSVQLVRGLFPKQVITTFFWAVRKHDEGCSWKQWHKSGFLWKTVNGEIEKAHIECLSLSSCALIRRQRNERTLHIAFDVFQSQRTRAVSLCTYFANWLSIIEYLCFIKNLITAREGFIAYLTLREVKSFCALVTLGILLSTFAIKADFLSCTGCIWSKLSI